MREFIVETRRAGQRPQIERRSIPESHERRFMLCHSTSLHEDVSLGNGQWGGTSYVGGVRRRA